MTSTAYPSRPSKLLPGKMRLASKMEPTKKLGVGLVAGCCLALLTYVSVAKLFAIYSPVFASTANTSAGLMPAPPSSSKPTAIPDETEAIVPDQPGGGSSPEEDEEAVVVRRKETAAVLGEEPGMKPQMVIVSRRTAAGTRRLLNLQDVAAAASELGFDVTVAVAEAAAGVVPARQVNSADVILAVHGAGLTEEQVGLLPAKAVVMQIALLPPWADETTAKANSFNNLELRYLEYKVGEEEAQGGWQEDVTVNLTKFRPFLLQALDRLQE